MDELREQFLEQVEHGPAIGAELPPDQQQDQSSVEEVNDEHAHNQENQLLSVGAMLPELCNLEYDLHHDDVHQEDHSRQDQHGANALLETGEVVLAELVIAPLESLVGQRRAEGIHLLLIL